MSSSQDGPGSAGPGCAGPGCAGPGYAGAGYAGPGYAGYAGPSYAGAGVDIEAGHRAVDLMRAAVARTARPEVVGGIGGFAGLFDASKLAG
jgi:phosphoribosylformylglycinamidine cyclo-ligase